LPAVAMTSVQGRIGPGELCRRAPDRGADRTAVTGGAFVGALWSNQNCFNDLWLAGELGFEPRQTESESVVLPLHHSPIIALVHQRVRWMSGQSAATGSRQIAVCADGVVLLAWSGPWQAGKEGDFRRKRRQRRHAGEEFAGPKGLSGRRPGHGARLQAIAAFASGAGARRQPLPPSRPAATAAGHRRGVFPSPCHGWKAVRDR
jgi:hypothetical protein